MKVKEIQRTANVAWSPAEQYPVFLAAGTAAQQLDATFSTSAALEIFSLDLGNSELEMPRHATVESEHRYLLYNIKHWNFIIHVYVWLFLCSTKP